MQRRTLLSIAVGVISVACAAGVIQQPAEQPPTFTTNDDPGGQGGILGVVRQSDTNEWISGALIVVQCTCLPQARETTTNAQGVFAINGLPAGKYTVQVLAGRGDISRVIDLPQGKQARLNMAMRPDQEFIRT